MKSRINDIIKKPVLYAGLFLFLLTGVNPHLYSQVKDIDSLKVHEKSFNETLYIVTDRDLYAAGEKVWLKIFKFNGLSHAPDDFSKVVYADILDLENNPLIQLKIAAEGYSCSSELRLPDTLRSGNYIVRAYTNWMQNFSRDLFASKTISVINPFDRFSNLQIPPSAQNPDSVIFYPEGGHLLEGFESLTGFRTVGRKGEPVMMTGALIDENSDTICRVKTGINGYGIFPFGPSGRKQLYLVSSSKNRIKRFPLPAARKEGILLSTLKTSNGSGYIARLCISPEYLTGSRHLYLLINSEGLAGIRKEITTGSESVSIIPDSEVPFGISHLSVMDDKGNILTDRWIYRNYDNPVNFKISLGQDSYAPREKIKIDITATDKSGKPAETFFSVSVAKAVAIKLAGHSDNFCQIPGMAPVEDDCKNNDINDYLLFYRPQEPSADQNNNNAITGAVYLPEPGGHLISGEIRERSSGEPLKNESITLSFVGKTALCNFTNTDASGNFNFVTREQGLKEIVIQPLTPLKECYVDLNNPFSAGYIDYNHGLFCPDTGKLDQINNLIISMQINNIYEPFFPRAARQPEERALHNFYGAPDNSIVMSKYIELTSVKEIIAELIPGVATTRNEGKINFRLTKPYQTRPFENGPLVLLDGVPVYDLEKVIGISSKEIEKVDVLIDRYFIAGNVLDGILHFITKKGNLSAIEPDRSVFRMEYDLLQKKEPFYSPDYSVDSLKTGHLPDFRNTLYWNPDLQTDKNGKALVEFYSSDESGEFIINARGITIDGKEGKASISLIVKSR